MREVKIQRKTGETQISLEINLDQSFTKINTGIGFFDHMLTLLSFHGKIGLNLEVNGDIEVDDHHTIEDVGIVLGQAFKEALGDRKGLKRYANQRIPMDEALVDVDLDISNRPFLVFNADFKREMVGQMSTEMVKEFLYAFAINGGITLHVNVLYGDNDHHKIEAIFKALGRALQEGSRVVSDDFNSTKGVL